MLRLARRSNSGGNPPVQRGPYALCHGHRCRRWIQRPVTATGQLSFIDNTVDSTTGTIKLKATFPNTDHTFWPGQFITVVMTLRTIDHATVVPSEAIQSGQQGQFAFVVKPDQTVETRVVTVGQTIDNQIVVQSGISPGETVVTDGQLRLFPGARIRVVPAAKADAGA